MRSRKNTKPDKRIRWPFRRTENKQVGNNHAATESWSTTFAKVVAVCVVTVIAIRYLTPHPAPIYIVDQRQPAQSSNMGQDILGKDLYRIVYAAAHVVGALLLKRGVQVIRGQN